MSVRAIEAEVSIKSGVQAECSIGREVIVEVHDDVNLEALTATENGQYQPASGVDGWDRVTVSVPERQPDIESLTATANGTYTSGKDGYNPVVIAVPERLPITESLSVTQNGTYTPPSGVDGFNSVTVDVSSSTPTPTQPTLTLVGQSTHTLTEYTDTSTAETIDTGIDVTGDNHSFLLVVITCDGTPAVENAWGGVYMDISGRYVSTGRIYPSASGMYESGTKTLFMSEASGFGLGSTSGPIHLVSNVPTVKFIRKALSNGRTVMAGTYNVKVYGIDSL